MSESHGTLTVRYGVRSDIGLHREDNEDAAYAGARRSSTRCGRWTSRCRPASC